MIFLSRLPKKYSLLNHRTRDLIKFLFFALLLLFAAVLGAQKLDYNWQWYRIPQYILEIDKNDIVLGPLLKGLGVTVQISAAGLFFAIVTGLVTALFRLSSSVTARVISRIYLEAVRNTPLLIQLFFIYFVLSPIFNLSAFVCAVAALALFEGAYTSEIIRAGILSVDKGQWEAAYSLGLSKTLIYLKIIFPQAIKQILPILAGQSVSLIKDSSLVSTIAIYDLTMRGQEIIADTFLSFEIWFTVAIMYLIVAGCLSFLVSKLERKK